MPNNERRSSLLPWVAAVVLVIASLAVIGWVVTQFSDHGSTPSPVVVSYDGKAAHLYGHMQVTRQPDGGLVTIAVTPERKVTLQVTSSPTAPELVPERIYQDHIRRYESVAAQPVAGNPDTLRATIPPGFYLVAVGLVSHGDDDDLAVYLSLKKGDPNADYQEGFYQPLVMVTGTFEWPH